MRPTTLVSIFIIIACVIGMIVTIIASKMMANNTKRLKRLSDLMHKIEHKHGMRFIIVTDDDGTTEEVHILKLVKEEDNNNA